MSAKIDHTPGFNFIHQPKEGESADELHKVERATRVGSAMDRWQANMAHPSTDLSDTEESDTEVDLFATKRYIRHEDGSITTTREKRTVHPLFEGPVQEKESKTHIRVMENSEYEAKAKADHRSQQRRDIFETAKKAGIAILILAALVAAGYVLSTTGLIHAPHLLLNSTSGGITMGTLGSAAIGAGAYKYADYKLAQYAQEDAQRAEADEQKELLTRRATRRETLREEADQQKEFVRRHSISSSDSGVSSLDLETEVLDLSSLEKIHAQHDYLATCEKRRKRDGTVTFKENDAVVLKVKAERFDERELYMIRYFDGANRKVGEEMVAFGKKEAAAWARLDDTTSLEAAWNKGFLEKVKQKKTNEGWQKTYRHTLTGQVVHKHFDKTSNWITWTNRADEVLAAELRR